jgi:hypothetical protein
MASIREFIICKLVGYKAALRSNQRLESIYNRFELDFRVLEFVFFERSGIRDGFHGRQNLKFAPHCELVGSFFRCQPYDWNSEILT